MDDKRKFKRLNTTWLVRMKQKSASDVQELTNKDKEAQTKNVGLGGIFVDTNMPFPLGTYLEMDLSIPGYPEALTVIGIVKWANASRGLEGPVGMGVEFLEVSTKNKSIIEHFVEIRTATETIKNLTANVLKQNLLKLYCKKGGEQFKLEDLNTTLGGSGDLFASAIKDFEEHKLIQAVSRDEIKFIPPTDKKLAELIQEWFKKQG